MPGVRNETMSWVHDLDKVIDSRDASAVFVVALPRLRNLQIQIGVQGMQYLAEILVARVKSLIRGDGRHQPLVHFQGLELIVAVPGLRRLGEVAATGEAIRHRCNDPIKIGLDQVILDSAVGVSVSPDNGRSACDLVAKAQIAADNASLAYSSGPTFFTGPMADAIDVARRIEMELRRALQDRSLSVVFQPQLRLSTGRYDAVEVLARWDHPIYGIISPGDFIPVAEAAGLMPQLGSFVLEEAVHAISAFNRNGTPMQLAVNVSPSQLMQDDFVFEVEDMLASADMSASELMVEITEGELLFDLEQACERLSDLRRLGARAAIDDFGAGFSNLAYLHKLPLDQIKIDRRFVAQLFEDNRAPILLRSAVELGHGLGLEVCVEGVETLPQLRTVRDLGSDLVQGFLFARPTAITELRATVARLPYNHPGPLNPPPPPGIQGPDLSASAT